MLFSPENPQYGGDNGEDVNGKIPLADYRKRTSRPKHVPKSGIMPTIASVKSNDLPKILKLGPERDFSNVILVYANI